MGFSQIPLKNYEDEKYYTSLSNASSSWGRLFSQLTFIKVLSQVRPKILICCTYEYLPVAAFFKGILGYKLIYDVQENYVKNLDLNPDLSSDKKQKVARLIRGMESAKGVDLFLLAEKCYQDEMPDKSPFLILENKYAGEIKRVSSIILPKKAGYNFLISGTLTPAFGTLEAVNWFKEIIKVFPDSTLKIIGHCTLSSFKKELGKACENIFQIDLKSSDFPVPHEEIIAEYSTADFAILPYQNREAIKDKMPTKLFESAALGIPVLIGGNPKWRGFLAPFSGGFPIDFFDLENANQQFNAALNQEYFTQIPDDTILWKSQHRDFIEAITSL
ncbi:glycosyltransferase family protein [Algoriphagus yeomjeoni]|nr:glycosyltransferase family 4 protein [Algoriphagus yeomjeoni]